MLICNLDELGPSAGEVFGGKAAGLGRLIGAGARVPAGFALEARAGGPPTWSAQERDALLQAAGALLAGGPIAIRSSAIGEDSSNASFAGTLESVLDVTTPEQALDAVGRGIAAGASERALRYSGRDAALPVGIVIQRQVDARAAGVCFTRDPAGLDGAVVLEAIAGRGELLVAGRSRPQRWRLYRSGFGDWEPQLDEGLPVLPAEGAVAIALEATQLAARLGQPLDLEWALDRDGTLWWLQARPITTGGAPRSFVIERAEAGVDDGPVTVWSDWNVGETMPEPLFPLTWSLWRDDVLPVVSSHVFGVPVDSPLMPALIGLDRVHGRIYFNLNASLALPLFGRLLPRLLEHMDARAAELVQDLTGRGILKARRLPGARLALGARMAIATLRSAARLLVALRPRHTLATLARDAQAIAARPAVPTLSDQALLAELCLFRQPCSRRLLFGLQLEGAAMAVFALGRRVFRHHPDALALLATGTPANPTTQISLALDELVEAAQPLAGVFRAAGSAAELGASLGVTPLGRAWWSRLEAFLARFGHRGPGEFDLGVPRWAEQPAMITSLVCAELASPAAEGARARMTRLARERDQAIAAAVAASPRWRRPLLRWVARLVELFMPLREAPKHYGLFVFERIRRAALEIGNRLADRGQLAQVEDVFFLELGELRELVARVGADDRVRERVAGRRAQLDRFRQERPPAMLRSDGVRVRVPAPAEEPGVLRGTAVSAGIGCGAVRIMATPDPQALAPGEVLVTRFADPGWTPLFPRAAAVVMEIGGLMCHAAVVARELGIPGVFGVADATTRLHDGERVEVDGTTGSVRIIPGNSE